MREAYLGIRFEGGERVMESSKVAAALNFFTHLLTRTPVQDTRDVLADRDDA